MTSTLTAGQMQPVSSAVPLSATDLYIHVLAALELYSMNTSIFITDNNATEVVTPSNFALYLWGICLSHVARVGTLAGSNKNDVCPDPTDYIVPVGFGKYLEQLGPYMSGESILTTTYELNSTLSTTGPGFGLGISGMYWGSNPDAIGNAKLAYGLISAQGGAIDELSSVSNGLLYDLDDLWSEGATIISQAILDCGLACVKYADIPERAPDASAYAVCRSNITGTVALPADGNAMWSCIDQNYSPDTANLFHSFENGGVFYGNNFSKPVVICTPLPGLDLSKPNQSQMKGAISPHFFNMWIGARQDTYRPGRLLKAYKLCNTKVKSLCFTMVTISAESLNRICATLLNEACRQFSILPTIIDLAQLNWLYYNLTLHCVVARMNQSSPFHYITGTDQGTSVSAPTVYAPQCSWVSREWLAIELPPALARFIDSIGPVNVNGYVTVPTIRSIESASNPNYTDGSIFPAWPIGTMLTIGKTSNLPAFGNMLQTLVTGSQPALGFIPTNTPIGNAQIAAYYADGQAYRRNFFFNRQMIYFTSLWDRLHKKYFAGVGLASSMVHLHNPPCGTAAAMLTRAELNTEVTGITIPESPIGAPYSYTVSEQQARVILSVVNLAADELVEAVMFRHVTTFSSALSNQPNLAKYKYALPGVTTSTQLLQSYANKTFAPDSGFARALAAREADFKPVVQTIGGVDLVSTSDSAGCYVKDLLKSAARESFNAIRFATPTAAGLVCNYLAPGSGGLCATGATRILDSVNSFIGIEADEHSGVSPKDVKEARRVVEKAQRKPRPLARTTQRRYVVRRPAPSPAPKPAPKKVAPMPKVTPAQKKAARKTTQAPAVRRRR